jgi:hypothetical protein
MAKHPDPSTIRKLTEAHDAAARAASENLAGAIQAADNAAAAGEGETRKLFKKQERRALKAMDNWQKAADNLMKALRKQKS